MIPDEKPYEANPRAVRGGNNPPSLLEELTAAQREAQSPHAERLGYIVERANAKTVTDRETAGDAGDIIRVAGEFRKKVDGERIDRTRPYRDAADAAKAVCDEFLYPLDAAVQELRDRLKEWSDDEDERIAQQQREQEAFFNPPAADPVEADVPAPQNESQPPKSGQRQFAAPPVKPARRRKITGDLGAVVSQVEKKHYRVIDVRAVPDLILNSQTVHDAIIQVAKSMGRHMPKIDGIEITTSTDNQIR